MRGWKFKDGNERMDTEGNKWKEGNERTLQYAKSRRLLPLLNSAKTAKGRMIGGREGGGGGGGVE